jgi:cell division protein FtsL
VAATEYALKKAVHNNAIVREVDEVRQRELWQWACIFVVFVVVLVVSVWQNWQFTAYGYAMQTVNAERAREEELGRQLRLQIEELRAPARIQQLAAGRGMVAPAVDEAVIVERVVPPPPPASSVVAAR